MIVRSATLRVDEPAFRAKVEALARDDRGDGRRRSRCGPFYSTRRPDARRRPAGRATIVPLGLRADGDDGIGEVVAIVDRARDRTGSRRRSRASSPPTRTSRRSREEDLQKGELQFGLPVGAARPAPRLRRGRRGPLPVLVALVAIVVALGLTALVGQAFDLSVFVVNMISGMGLALGIDYSLFVVFRYREERRRGQREARRDRRRRVDRVPRGAVQRLGVRARDGGHGAGPRHDPPQPRRGRGARRHRHGGRGADAAAGGARARSATA